MRQERTAEEVHDVWNAIDELRGDLGSIRASQASMVTKIDQVVDTIRSINRDRKPQWGVLIGAVSAAVMLVSAIGGTALAPLYLSDAYQLENFKQHVDSGGHPEVLQVIASLNRDIHRLDEKIDSQRELNDARRTALAEKVENNSKHLAGRDGLRFNMPDYERMVEPHLSSLESRLLEVESSRYSGDEAKADIEKLRELIAIQGERLAVTEAESNRSVREQERRTGIVYGAGAKE